MLRNILAVLTGFGTLAVAPLAWGGTITLGNTTDTVAYSSGVPYALYTSGNPYVSPSAIGVGFDTPLLKVTSTNNANGVMLDLQYITQFSGTGTDDGSPIGYSDIFLRPGNAGYSTSPFTYAISLGDQSANGGLSAGFYQVTKSITSNDIWASHPTTVIGGQYTNTTAYEPGQAGYAGLDAQTVLTGGSKIGRASIHSSQLQGGDYVLDVSIELSGAAEQAFANGYDVFWGTGDCGNDSFLASLPILNINEPDSLWVYGAGLFILVASYWRTLPRRRVRQGIQAQFIPGAAQGRLARSLI